MDLLFQVHNQHLKGVETFKKEDPQLKKLYEQHYLNWPREFEDFLKLPVGIYTLTGRRQIGKSTLSVKFGGNMKITMQPHQFKVSSLFSWTYAGMKRESKLLKNIPLRISMM